MRKFQKTLAVILSVLMLTALFVVGAGAATSEISLTTDKNGVIGGETFTISVNVAGDVAGAQGKLSFEKDKVQFVSVAINDALKPTNTLNNSYVVKEDYVEFMLIGSENAVEGAWMTVTFLAKETDNSITANFTLNDAVAVIGETKETPSVTSVSVGIASAVSTGIVGDLNNDGTVDLLDLVRMKKDLAITAPVTTVNDVNKDTKFDAQDAALMIQYLLGVITQF